MPPRDTIIANLRKNEDYIKFLTLSGNHIGLPLKDLVEALHVNQTLRQVSCRSVFMATLTSDQVVHLFQAIATLPRLEELVVAFPSNRTHLSSGVIQHILIAQQQQQPKRPSKLRKLVLQGFDNDACLALAKCLQQKGYSRLVAVELVEGTEYIPDASRERGPQAMAQLLQQNSSLEKLVISYNCKNSLECCDVKALAQALSKNKTLQHLDLRCRSSSTTSLTATKAASYEPLVKMFEKQSNETVTKLVTDAPESVQTELDFYTELNNSGGPKLVRRPSAHHDEWMNLLLRQQQQQQAKKAIVAKTKVFRVRTIGRSSSNTKKIPVNGADTDVSVLFHTLRQNPRFLLSYNPDQDPHANVRPAFLRTLPTKVSPKRSKTTTQTTLRNLQRRRKPKRAPSCFALNVPDY